MISFFTRLIKDRQMLPVIMIFCVCILLLILPQGVKVIGGGFINRILYYPFNQLDNFLTDVTSATGMNVELNQRLADCSIRSAQFIEDHYENIRLRRMLGFDLQIPYKLVPAEVIGLKPGLTSRSIVVNAGQDKGAQINMPVVTADGIVGKIIDVALKTSVVQLIIDHNCKVSVIDQNTRAMGIIRWQGGKFLEMGDVPVENDVAVGDTIISSGLGGIFPPSLLVGTVVYSLDSEGRLFKDIKIQPSVDFGTLEEVFIVVYGE
jgi:rod shape-determining protein MreC